MDITKSKLINIIIIIVLGIPLDQEIYDFSVDFLQAHPAIYKALSLLKKLTYNANNPNKNQHDGPKNKNTTDDGTKPNIDNDTN